MTHDRTEYPAVAFHEMRPDDGLAVPRSLGPGLTVMRESHAAVREIRAAPADLVDAGVTFRVQPGSIARRYAAVSLLGDRMAAAPDVETLFTLARAWLANHYYHVRRMQVPAAPARREAA